MKRAISKDITKKEDALQRWKRVPADNSRQQQYDEKWEQVSDKFHQTPQHWIAARIFIETYTETATMAQIGRTDKYQRKHYSRRMQRDCRCI